MEASAEYQDNKSIDLKKEALNLFIKVYTSLKTDYLQRSEEPNLMSYFDRNKQNLRGVFESCMDNLLNLTKVEKFSRSGRGRMEEDNFTADYSIGRFWLSQCCYPYISLLERVMSLSKNARREFYTFLTED